MIRKLLLMFFAVVFVLGAIALPAQEQGSGGKEKATLIDKNKDVTEPVLVTKVIPKYPAEAKKEKITGEVVLEITIGVDGAVLDAKAVKSPDKNLSDAAVEAVKQWKYTPARTKEGKAVEVRATVTMNFKLK